LVYYLIFSPLITIKENNKRLGGASSGSHRILHLQKPGGFPVGRALATRE
jgi:hypothetical protein